MRNGERTWRMNPCRTSLNKFRMVATITQLLVHVLVRLRRSISGSFLALIQYNTLGLTPLWLLHIHYILTILRYLWWRYFHLWKDNRAFSTDSSWGAFSSGQQIGAWNYCGVCRGLFRNWRRLPFIFRWLWWAKMFQNGSKHSRTRRYFSSTGWNQLFWKSLFAWRNR